MNTRKIVTAAACLLSLQLAAPSQAHPPRTPYRNDMVHDDIDRLHDDIERADRNDVISEREAADLRARLTSLRSEFDRLNDNGLTRPEVRALEQRINYIRSRLHMEKVDYDRHAG